MKECPMTLSRSARSAALTLARSHAGGKLTRMWRRVKGLRVLRAAAPLGRLGSNCSGTSALLIALSMTGILGVVGLGTEVGMWYVSKRDMQGSSDSAAYSAAIAKYRGETVTQAKAEAKRIASSYSLVDGSNGVTVTVNNPPTKGNYTADSNAFEVIITQQQPLVVSGLFLSGATTVRARSVALEGTPGNGCVIALDGASVDDIFNNGSTTINLVGCDIYDNSPSSSALTMVGSATMNANGAYIVGNYSTSGNGTLTTGPPPTGDGTNVNWSAPIPDPFATDLANFTSPTNCTYNGLQKYNAGVNIPASTFASGQVFCGGIDITGNSTVNFPAGVFYITNGTLQVDGGSTLKAPNGTTFVLSGNSMVSFQGGSNINVVADADPKSPFPGVAFAVASPSGTGVQTFNGGATMNVTGAVYSPNNSVAWAGGSNTTGTPCTQIVALTIAFKGNAVLGDNCTGYAFPISGFGKQPTKIVE
jgi:Flp pilus assembly protein TadG